MPQKIPKPSRTYWILQILGWTAYGLTGYVTNVRFNSGVDPSKVAGLAFSGACLLFLFTHLLRRHAHRRAWTRLGFGRLILRLLSATLLLSAVSQGLVSLLMLWPFPVITEAQPYRFGILALYIFQTQIILLLWSLAYFSYHAIRNYKSEEIEKWRLHAGVKDAELIALKAQINPHFLFNCLNNIRSLVLEDPIKARDAITKLSDLLRRSIAYNQAETVTLGAELDVVRDYLDLESIHMEKRLQYSITIGFGLETFEIPPMSIQLLVENAIKHSLAKLPAGGQLSIEAQGSSNCVTIDVANTGQLATSAVESTGIGLQNIRERLQLLHGASARLTLEQASGNRVCARICLPR